MMSLSINEFDVPGAPSALTPEKAEPTSGPVPRLTKDDQSGPDRISPTGAADGDQRQQGETLTTAQGARLTDTDHSLKAGPRGPILLQDHHFREKITHFDHERIPERVVHARGAAAHGVFRANGAAENITSAAFLRKDVETPVFVRFSTVLGSRGSADTVRDTRGFATKFYTEDGTFDLVGNNIPVFFIQDAIKFPDIIHAGKPHPDREIPQAQSAHDTFWDFVTLHTEATAHTMWNMSDRGIPRSYRMMEGFGVHTFRMVDADGKTSLVKFHWKPRLGVHSLVWEEAQIAAGVDPDFHRRDLADAIESGAYPEWTLGVQVFPDTPEQEFEGIDLLDPTKFVPEELAPVQPIGVMTLNANPTNYFAETEQVAFHPGHLVPGIDVTDDPLLQGRLFSYLDTQISRLGGPNFGQLPINRPHAPVNDMLRDGMHQTAVHDGVAPYKPNSLDGGCPFTAAPGTGFVDVPVPIEATTKQRTKPSSFDDHFSQPRLFYTSLSEVEQRHLADAYSFELGKCFEQPIKERALEVLARVDKTLCEHVAGSLGLPVPEVADSEPDLPSSPSAALSQIGGEWPVEGRNVAVLVDEGSAADSVEAVLDVLSGHGVVPLVTAPHGGRLTLGDSAVTVSRTYDTARSIEFDAVLSLTTEPDARVVRLLDEAFRHGKAVGADSNGAEGLASGAREKPGVHVGDDLRQVTDQVVELMRSHRVWQR
ncbi:catalase [Rhodococcus hoagii]|nr:catalase [Prescottella equi]